MMISNESTRALMKNGLIAAAAIVVIRIVLEQTGLGTSVTNIFGVAWLYFVMPILFGIKIADSGGESPYKALFKDTIFFGLYTRIMVAITYTLAYFLSWGAPRFSTESGGVVGENISMLMGALVIPLRNLAIWVVFATIVGMLIGGLTVFIKTRASKTAAA